MSLLWDCYAGPSGSSSHYPSGTVLYSNTNSSYYPSQAWSFTIPAGVTSVTVQGWGGGGGGSLGPSPQANLGPGGGGGGNFSKVVSVSGGTILSGVIGSGGVPNALTNGAATTLASPACSANGGTTAKYGGSEGVGGTASGGGTNTSGNNGGITNTWSGGGAGNGGGDQNTANSFGTSPGGGGSGGGGLGGGSNGRQARNYGASGLIKITVT